jgi:hypothetical protein
MRVIAQPIVKKIINAIAKMTNDLCSASGPACLHFWYMNATIPTNNANNQAIEQMAQET